MRLKSYELPSGNLVVDPQIAAIIDAANDPAGGENLVFNDLKRSGGILYAAMTEWIPPSLSSGVVLRSPPSTSTGANDASVALIENALKVGPVVVCAVNKDDAHRVFVLTEIGFGVLCGQGEFRGKTVYDTSPDLARMREGVGTT